MIDVYSDDPAEKYQAIRRELEKYSESLAERPEIIALTKCEGLDDEIIAMQSTALQKVANGAPVVAISSQTHDGVTELLRMLRDEVAKYREREAEIVDEKEEDLPTISLDDQVISDAWSVRRVSDAELNETDDEDEKIEFIVTGAKIEKFARRTNFDQFESVNRLRDIMRKMGITHELLRQGAIGESLIQIGESMPFTLVEQ
jgi:GTPase obg